jgi:hypothetical protein
MASLLVMVFCAVLGYMHVTQRARVRAHRRALFDGCLHRFDDVEVAQDGINYPVLAGRYCGFDVNVEAIVDHVSFRKLPQLLVVVTLRAPVPWGVVMDVLARPQNTEFYAPWSRLSFGVNGGSGWPAHLVARTDSPEPLPFVDVLDRRMSLFEDQKMKELLITPRGVRLVYRLREGERGPYLLLRQAVFEGARLDAQLADRLLCALIALHEDLCRASAPRPTYRGCSNARNASRDIVRNADVHEANFVPSSHRHGSV